jgi:hypothetical protein
MNVVKLHRKPTYSYMTLYGFKQTNHFSNFKVTECVLKSYCPDAVLAPCFTKRLNPVMLVSGVNVVHLHHVELGSYCKQKLHSGGGRSMQGMLCGPCDYAVQDSNA